MCWNDLHSPHTPKWITTRLCRYLCGYCNSNYIGPFVLSLELTRFTFFFSLFSLRSYGEFGMEWETQAHTPRRYTSQRSTVDRIQVNTYDIRGASNICASGGNVYKTHATSRKLYHFSDSISEVRLFPKTKCLYSVFILFLVVWYSFERAAPSTFESVWSATNFFTRLF